MHRLADRYKHHALQPQLLTRQFRNPQMPEMNRVDEFKDQPCILLKKKACASNQPADATAGSDRYLAHR